MDRSPMVKERLDAARRFVDEFESFAPVVTAFWLKADENDRWSLYVASDGIPDEDFTAAYAEVHRIAPQWATPWFDPFEVRIIGIDDPMVRSAVEVYTKHSAKIPLHLRDVKFGRSYVDDVYLVRGPTTEFAMPTGRDALNTVIDGEAAYFDKHGRTPKKMKLPILMAYDLAKCGWEQIGDLSGKVFKNGIDVFEKEGFHGMKVEIVRSNKADLQFE